MKNRIYYIGYYGECNHVHTPSATYKMRYICRTLNELGLQVSILSASGSRKGIDFGGRKRLYEGTDVRYFPSVGTRTILAKVITHCMIMFQFFLFLMFRVRKSDTIILYHSLRYMSFFRIIGKIRAFKVVMEVEELYGTISRSDKLISSEIRSFKRAESFIFPTERLNARINPNNKPYTIVHGSYYVEPKIIEKYDDGRVHLVYSGSFDCRKGGVDTAILAASLLDERYCLHVSGGGSPRDIERVKQIISTQKTQGATIVYEGMLNDEAYINLLQKCHIGLNTFNPDGMFNDASFPSKLLAYLANGLRVVSVDILPVRESSISELLYYYDEPIPERIAETIVSIDVKGEYDSRKDIMRLHELFKRDLLKLVTNA